MKNILFIALLLSASTSFGDDSFRVVGIHDGDSITVLSVEKKQIKIRLEGIDAPELKQPFGSRAKEHLSSLIMGKDVSLIVKGEDLYKRTLWPLMTCSRKVCSRSAQESETSSGMPPKESFVVGYERSSSDESPTTFAECRWKFRRRPNRWPMYRRQLRRILARSITNSGFLKKCGPEPWSLYASLLLRRPGRCFG